MRARLTAYFRNNRLTLLLIGLIFLGSGLFTYFYISSEKAFYVWDNSSYYSLTGDLLQQFQTSFQAGFRFIIESNQSDYNVYYALPLLPIPLITGNSRQVYEIGLVIVYLVPFLLVTGLIGRKLIGRSSGRVFWLVVVVGLFLPTAWLPTLRGYPDTAASLALALTIWIYLKDPGLKRVGQLVCLGLLIGLAILIRRHFLYSAVAFFGAAGIVTLVGFAKEARFQFGKAARKLIEKIFQLGLVGVFAVLLVALFDLQIILKVIFIDYYQLYASYLVPWWQEGGWLLDSFGWLVFGGAIVGLFLIWRKSDRKEEVLFFALFGLFELAVWVLNVRQISVQYTLHLTVFIVVGLAGLLVYAWEKLKTGQRTKFLPAARIVGIAFLGLNCLAGLFLPAASFPAVLFSGNWQPLQRDDYQQVVNLTKYLDEQTAWDDKIYVLASSYRFNAQTFLQANEAATGKKGEPTIQLLISPDIDSRDFYPLDALLQASIVVMIDPYQIHIAPDQQQVVRVVYDMFKQNLGLAQDFAVLNDNFTIDSQTKATIFKRTRPTSPDNSLKSLQIMQSYVKKVPGNQYDWINLDPAQPVGVQLRVNNGTALVVDSGQWKTGSTTAGTALVYARPVSGREIFQGKVSEQQAGCGEITVDFSSMEPEKTPARFAEFKLKPSGNTDLQVDFSKVAAGQFALIQLTPPVGCSFTLELTPVS